MKQLLIGVSMLMMLPFIACEDNKADETKNEVNICLLYTSPSPRDGLLSRMPSSA